MKVHSQSDSVAQGDVTSVRNVFSTRSVLAVVWVTLALSLGVRLFLLRGPLDVPDWRQADTTYMAYRMWRETPPQVLYPKTPFRGHQDIKAAEFPVYPLVVSLVYKIAGKESLPLARAVTLLFFVGAVWFFFRGMKLLGGGRVALLAAAVYCLLPLGIPYSRMVHPDFCILFFAHMFFFYGLHFFRSRRALDYILAVAACTLVFLMKAPYGFYLGLPVAVYAFQQLPGRRVRGMFLLSGMFVVPLIAALWFNSWRIALEADHTESLVYPMKWTAESLRARFFGTLAQRLDWHRWSFLLKRSVVLVCTLPGALLAAWGAVVGILDRELRRATTCLWMLIVGVGLYTLLVFPMVSSDHDYYSLPFLLPVAAATALALEWTIRRGERWRYGPALVTAAMMGLLAFGSWYGIRRGPFLYGPPYFAHDWQRILAGRVINEETTPDDLVLSVTLGRSTGWSDPRILYYARRRGWARQGECLTEQDLKLYRQAGATVAALLLTPVFEPRAEQFGVLAEYPWRVREIRRKGELIGWVVLFDLRDPKPGTGSGTFR